MPSCCSSCGGATASSPTTAAGDGRCAQAGHGHDMDHYAAKGRHSGRVVARVVERSPGTSPGAVAAGLPGPSSWQRSRRVATDRLRFDCPCVDVSRSVIRNGWCQGVAGSAPAHHEGIRAFAETGFTADLRVSCSSTPPGQRSRWPGRGTWRSARACRTVCVPSAQTSSTSSGADPALTKSRAGRAGLSSANAGRHAPASTPASPCPGCGNSSRSCADWSADPSGTASACCVRCAAPAGAARPPT